MYEKKGNEKVRRFQQFNNAFENFKTTSQSGNADEYNVDFYLWGNYVSPVFIIIAIYLSYSSINKINQTYS